MVVASSGMTDELYMDRALALASRARGLTSPNPMVGVVVVSQDGLVVGTGFHERAGEAHAEVRALDEAGSRAQDATLYSTLEPCSHQGRTGPCAPRIVAAGIRRVVIGISDPNPSVGGAGIAYLREYGLQVDVGVRSIAATKLNKAFLTWITRGRPFVTMKIATSLDGCIAARPGARTRITGEAANAAVHRTRAEEDAIVVGSTTILVDDPQLTVRGVSRVLPLTRVVLDRRLRMPPSSRVLQTLDVGPVIVMTTKQTLSAKHKCAEELRVAGATVESLNTGTITEAMVRLGKREITSLLLEGGASVHRAAWSAGLVDRVQRYISPVTFGDHGVQWLGSGLSMANLHYLRVEGYGPDVLMEGYVYRFD